MDHSLPKDKSPSLERISTGVGGKVGWEWGIENDFTTLLICNEKFFQRKLLRCWRKMEVLDCFRSEDTNWWVSHLNSSGLEEQTKKKNGGRRQGDRGERETTKVEIY